MIVFKGTYLYIEINRHVGKNKLKWLTHYRLYAYINHSCSRVLPDLGPGILIPLICILGSLILILHQSVNTSRALYASALKGIAWYRVTGKSWEDVVSVILSGMVGLARLLVIFIG